MRRREFIVGLAGAAAWPIASHAQQSAIPTVGFLNLGSADQSADRVAAFREGLREAGFVERRNVTVEFRWADGRYNVELGSKRLEFLLDLRPNISRFGLLVNSQNKVTTDSAIKDASSAAVTSGRSLEVLAAGSPREIDTAFDVLAQMQVEALVVMPDPMFTNRRVQLATHAARHMIPLREFADAGRRADELWRRQSGAQPADRHLCRSNTQGRKASRHADPTTHEI